MINSITDEQMYQNIKKNHKLKQILMDAEEWKRLRLIQLNKERKVWSK